MRNYAQSPVDLAARRYFGGAPKMQKPPTYSPPPMPAMPAAPKPPPPPPEVQNMSASDAADQARRQAAQRDGYRKTLLAGETGGVGANPVTGKSLLG
jgi:hypothetical protein